MKKEKESLITNEEKIGQPAFTVKRGNKTYSVYLHFKKDYAESIDDKLKKMLEKKVENGEIVL